MVSRLATVLLMIAILALASFLLQAQGGWLRPPVTQAEPAARAASLAPIPTGQGEDAPVVLIGAGDISVCGLDGDDQTAALLKHLLLRYPGAEVFTAGDNAQTTGEMYEYKDCFGPTWGQFRKVIHPSPGNHDWFTEEGAAYFSYFDEGAGPRGVGYYSYDLGQWHIVSLSSNCGTTGCGEESSQAQWLRDDLDQNNSMCELLYWHHPLWSSGLVPIEQGGQAFWRIAHEAGADVVVNGHDHHYERFAMLDAEGRFDPVSGMRLFIAGTGGAWLFDVKDPLAVTEALDNSTHGLLVFFLYADRYEWQFVSVEEGGYTDSGSGTCH